MSKAISGFYGKLRETHNVHTIVRHSQDGDLSDGTVPSFYTASAFVNGGQISVHVTGITTTTGHFFSGS